MYQGGRLRLIRVPAWYRCAPYLSIFARMGAASERRANADPCLEVAPVSSTALTVGRQGLLVRPDPLASVPEGCDGSVPCHADRRPRRSGTRRRPVRLAGADPPVHPS